MRKEIVCFALDSILIKNIVLLQILVNVFLHTNALKNTAFITHNFYLQTI